MPPKFCVYCGTKIEPGQHFCPNCFRPLNENSEQKSSALFCPYCGYENEPNSLYCNRCGFKLMERCPICGTLNPLEGNVSCLNCGTPLSSGKELVKNLKRKTHRSLILLYFYLALFFLNTLLAVWWWMKLSVHLTLFYRYLGLIVLIFLATILIFALFNAYHIWLAARKEEEKIKHWSKQK